MKLQLKGNIEIELPDGASVSISEDGTKVKVADVPTAEPEVIEKIRIVEVAGAETIRYVPQPWNNWIYTTPPLPVYPTYPWYPAYPWGTTPSGTIIGGWPTGMGNIGISGTGNSSFTLTNFQTGIFGSQTDGGDASCVSIN
jgi:hypothetical protein